ncbi:hypothetical protein DH2020_022795 [Rehmannia glutinosa]|uniref:histone acetyltransferase n=1 Tax=Rehmannia glutinosa TaxID=99300 RepID=A0ABR0W524_REHGL
MGRFTLQVPNQAGTMLPGLPQQNGIPVPGQIQNPIINRGIPNTDSEYVKTRKYMQEKIWEFLMKRRHQSHEVPNRKMIDLVKRLEEALFKSATTTKLISYFLSSLLHSLIFLLSGGVSKPGNFGKSFACSDKTIPMSNHNQQFSHANSSPSIDSSVLANNSSNTIASSTANSGNFLTTGSGSSGNMHGGSFGSSDGTLCLELSQMVINSLPLSQSILGNNMVTSMGVQRMTSQMIPTPGFNNSNNNEVNNNANNQSFMNMESSNNNGAYPVAEPSIVSQPMQQKQRVGGQNSRILHNIGGHMGGGVRSTMQQKSYGLSNGPLNGGLGMMGNNMSMMNGPGTTEGYLSGTIYGNSTKPLHQHFDQHQRPVMQGTVVLSSIALAVFCVCGDGYGIGGADASGSGNLYVPVSSVGSMMNNQSLNALPMQSMAKTNSQLMINNQSNLHSTQQVTTMKPQLIDQSEKMNFQPQYSVRENLVQPHQQFQQSSHQFQRQQLVQHQVHYGQQTQNQQLVQHQVQHGQQTQNQLLLKNDTLGQSQLSSNMVSEAKSGHGTEHHDERLQSQVSDPFQFSDMQSQFQQNSMEDCSRASQLLSHPSGPQDVSSSLTQTSDQMQQLLHPQQFVGNCQSDFGGLSGGIQPEVALRGQWYSKSQDVSHVSGRLPHEPNVQDEFHHRLNGHDVAQLNNLSSEESMIGQSDVSRPAEPQNASNAVCRANNLNRERQFKNQQRWLLFLRHARRCPAPEGKCQEPNCFTVQKLLKHMEHCNVVQCSYPRCCATRAQLKAIGRSDFKSGLPSSVNGSCKLYETAEVAGRSNPKTSPMIAETPEDLQPSIKRMKIEQGSQSVVSESETSVLLASAVNESPLQDAQHFEQYHDSHIPMKSEIAEVKMEAPGSVGQLSSKMIEMKKDNLEDAYNQRPEVDPTASNNPAGFGIQEVLKSEKAIGQTKVENPPLPSENTSKSGKPKIKGVSMTELFTPEQVRQHITGLRQWVGQALLVSFIVLWRISLPREETVQLVAFLSIDHKFSLHNLLKLDLPSSLLFDGTAIPKARMEKKKNDEETEEWWVQCDKCEAWQHQICALFNGRRNDGGQAEYTCPNCYIEEVERGERVPLPQSAVLGAKDLPRTILSDHMEQRLFAKLKQERQDRARLQGKSYDEVPGAESLVVRVVSSVDKKLEVKPRFLEIFQEENYPVEYPYKSKVVLLFQKIEGVEVCLFGMYVQEFGSECQQPNHRRVYLSYLDSVKYFRPEVFGHVEKAAKENIVVELTNLYDHFFVSNGECKAKVTAARALKASGQTDLSGNASKDLLLMHKLGETISPMKEDFIMVHLQPACTHCCILMVSGNRWVCKQCKNFQLCDRCYDAERKRETEKDIQSTRRTNTHFILLSMKSLMIPKTKMKFLRVNSLTPDRRFLAFVKETIISMIPSLDKHSSMMVLYHLHNPTAPAFVTTCNVCHLDIETGQGWRCETCPDYDVCNACFSKDGGIDHPHKLTNHPSNDRDAQNKEARQLRVMQLRKMLDLLVHASQCRSPHCQYPNCRKVKGLFRHGMLCKARASGGCVLCKKMWYLLQLHARACKESECNVPRCRDLKEHMRRLQQQSDSRRRAAVMEMMRQRAAEVAGNS